MKLAPQEVRTYFVTTVTSNRRRLFQVSRVADLMLDVLMDYRGQNRFLLHAFAIMPDHLHLLITPSYEVSLEKALQFIKGGFSFRLKSKRTVWERGFNEVQIRSAGKFLACKRYIEGNPVQAGLADSASDFRYCSENPATQVDPMPDHFRQAAIRG